MANKTILISGVGGDIGQSVAQALIDKGFDLIGCDMNDVPFYRLFLKRFYIIPPVKNKMAYFQSLKEIFSKENVSFFIPTSEPEIYVLNEHRDFVESAGIPILINSKNIVDIFSDKFTIINFLGELGIKTPRTVLMRDVRLNEWTFPLIVKRRKGSGGSQVWLVGSQFELEYLEKLNSGNLIVQEYVGTPEEEYTTTVFSDGVKASSITFRRKLGYSGLSKEVVLVDEPFLGAMAQKVATAAGLRGSINIQTRRFDSIFIPFEVNPRISSTVLFRKEFGFEDAWWWIELLSGRGYSFVKKYSSGRGFRYLASVFMDMRP